MHNVTITLISHAAAPLAIKKKKSSDPGTAADTLQSTSSFDLPTHKQTCLKPKENRQTHTHSDTDEHTHS